MRVQRGTGGRRDGGTAGRATVPLSLRSTVPDLTFAERVRREARRLGVYTARDLAGAVGVMSGREKKQVSSYIRIFIQRGEMERVNQDGPALRGANGKPCMERYRYTPKAAPVTNRQRMWNVVRRMPSPVFFIRDLEQITGIKYGQIKRFTGWLASEGWAERVGKGRYRRRKEMPVDCPVDRRERAALAEHAEHAEGSGGNER